VTKSDIIKLFAEQNNMPLVHAEALVNAILGAMTDAMKRGERIEIRGFGIFEIREYRGYKGRNPSTGEKVTVEPKKLPFFRIGKELKARINENGGE
jgi:integration host factor subunit beta